MNRRTLIWIGGGALVIAFAIFAFSPYAPWAPQPPAQPEQEKPGPLPPGLLTGSAVHRFKVVEMKGDTLVVLDTKTGDLYQAPAEVYQQYRKRPKGKE